MYVQITTRCNMQCEHCCYACGPQGADMSRTTFITACKLAEDYGGYINIGGGEPTIHDLFWDFIGIAIGHQDESVPWLATNGKIKDTALRLAKVAAKGILSVDLSLDPYHENINQEVVEAFTPKRTGDYISKHNDDFRHIRDITNQGTQEPIPIGRAASWARYLQDADGHECICDDLFIAPYGQIFNCGCQQFQFGNVYQPQIPDMPDDGWHSFTLLDRLGGVS